MTAGAPVPVRLTPRDPRWPARLGARLGREAPSELFALGNVQLLAEPKTAFFCSARSPGQVILPAHDQAERWREAGRCVISGFHSPLEADCLQFLLRGTQPLIVCPARGLPQRLPAEWQTPLAEGRLLILSAFPAHERRMTTALAERRNALVAALADEVCFAHISPGGRTARLAARLAIWGVPCTVLA